MIMEVPPFHWPKPALYSTLRDVLWHDAAIAAEKGPGEMSGGKEGYTSLRGPFFPVMLYVGKPSKWGAFTRLETRTKESNRRAREKILLPVLLSY